MTAVLSDTELILFLKQMRKEPKGVMAALARLVDADHKFLRRVQLRNYFGGSEQAKWLRVRLTHIIPFIRSGRLQFERRSPGKGGGRKNKTNMFPIMVEQPVEERLVLHYPAEYLRSIARTPHDLPNLRLQPLRHRVHVGRRGPGMPEVQGHGTALGSGRRAWRHP